MKQLSQYFSVVGETKEFTICEIPLGEHEFWRFVIAWDRDHDERIVPLVEHWVAMGWIKDAGVRVVGETKGFVYIDAQPTCSDFHEKAWSVKGDIWNVEVDSLTDWDHAIRIFSCGEVKRIAQVWVIA